MPEVAQDKAGEPDRWGERLPRKLGIASAIAVLVGSTIGSGIFRSPAVVAQDIDAMLPFVLLYMPSIQASMTRPMVPPIVIAMKMRLWLKRMWLHSQEPTNITQYITTMPVRIIAANRRYIFDS